MARQVIQDFLIDDENLDEFATHGVSDDQVLQVLEDECYLGRNKRGRGGSHLVIGFAYSGGCLTAPSSEPPTPACGGP